MTRVEDGALGCCHVVAGGCAHGEHVSLGPRDLLIAADAGYALCERLGLTPDVLVGDFDSLGPAFSGARAREVVKLPCAKDDTDTLAALRIGLARGYTRFHVHAAFGGDVGHELANIHCLSFLERHGARGVLSGGGQRALLVTPQGGPLRLNAQLGERISIFAFGGGARDVRVRGTRWELDDASLNPGDPVGVSNEAVSTDVELSVGEGALIVIMGDVCRVTGA